MKGSVGYLPGNCLGTDTRVIFELNHREKRNDCKGEGEKKLVKKSRTRHKT